MSLLRVADYIANRLIEHNITDVFLVTGGGAMHLNDALGNHPNLTYYCNQHEQACAIAAEGYYRASGKLPVVNVTTGPGGTNAITGVLGQWTDSIPALYISGQVKWETTIDFCPELHLRQLGDQEADIISVVRPITKFAVMVKDSKQIKKILDKALFIATHGRPGPVWIDIPLNVQGAMIETDELEEYDEKEDAISFDIAKISSQVDMVVEKLNKSTRPALFLGLGVRLSGATKELDTLLKKMPIPVMTAISGHDLIETEHPLFFGRPGICGDRIGNIMIQNADLLLVLGTRVGLRQSTYNFQDFGRNAFKIMADIDQAELDKPTFKPDLKVFADIKLFLEILLQKLEKADIKPYTKWLNWGQKRKKSLPTMLEDNPSINGFVNSYLFADRLFKLLPKNSQVVTGNGTAYTCTYQIMNISKGTRVFANQGCASMGYDLPAAIGACIARKMQDVVLITGDGSIMMNIQELQTIAAYQLPVKIFLLENNGYVAIRTTQTSFFNKRYVGESPVSKMYLPDFQKVSNAFGIKHEIIASEGNLDEKIQSVLNYKGPVFCEIKMNPDQTLFPKVASMKTEDGRMISKPMEEMFPFLSDSEQEKCRWTE